MRGTVAGLVACGVLALAPGCGGSGSDDSTITQVDSADLAAAFSAAATDAYEAAGLNRERDYTAGTKVDDCFILDAEGGEAVAEAAGSDAPEVEVSHDISLSGAPDRAETLNCTISDPSEAGPRTSLIGTVAAGSTTLTPDQYERNLLRLQGGNEISGTAEGLPADEVVAVDRGGVMTFVWVHDDFLIGFSGPTGIRDPSAGLAALPTVVDEVQRTLTG